MSFGEFLSMGGYGFYIWMSFGMTAVLAVLEIATLKRGHVASLQRLRRMARFDAETAHEAQK